MGEHVGFSACSSLNLRVVGERDNILVSTSEIKVVSDNSIIIAFLHEGLVVLTLKISVAYV